MFKMHAKTLKKVPATAGCQSYPELIDEQNRLQPETIT